MLLLATMSSYNICFCETLERYQLSWSSVIRVVASNMQMAYSVCEVFYKEPMASVKIVKSACVFI